MTTGVFHREAAAGTWFELSLMEQLGNIGTEVGRAARATEARNEERAWNALVRTLELFDLTIADDRWRGSKRREICRAREVVCDFVAGDNQYNSSAESLDRYFLPFAFAARKDRSHLGGSQDALSSTEESVF
jgi:hypothetical protein